MYDFYRKRLIVLGSPLSGFAIFFRWNIGKGPLLWTALYQSFGIFFRWNIGKGPLLWVALYQSAQSFEEDYITQAVPKDRLFIPD